MPEQTQVTWQSLLLVVEGFQGKVALHGGWKGEDEGLGSEEVTPGYGKSMSKSQVMQLQEDEIQLET